MPKNIILCSDGTGNTAIKGRGTNVFKLYEALDLNSHKFNKSLTEQVAFYDDGVGTESLKFLKAIGGAFGWGLSRNVRELYTELARCYRPGDSIYVFGFSRGAFTVRQLAGFILGCGIIDRKLWNTDGELKKLVRKAFRIYRKRYHTWLGDRFSGLFSSSRKAREDFRKAFAVNHETHSPQGLVRIKFIGVWDTVAAVGLPFDGAANFINKVFYRFKFPDLQLSSRVDKACHALSIDDERHSFHPEVWDEENEETDGRVEQVWFPGVHSNVGGGYPKQGISLVALDWMMSKAEQYGLRFIGDIRKYYQEHHNVNDKLYDSRSGIGAYYRYKVRDIGKICANKHTVVQIHSSAFNRIMIGTDGYAPVNISAGLNIAITQNKTPSAAEDPESIKKLTDKVNKAITTDEQFLKTANKWKSVRRYSHYAFIALTIVLVLLVKNADSSAVIQSTLLSRLLKIIGFIIGDTLANNFIKPIFTHPELAIPLALLILFYFVGMLAKSRINKIFSAFWRKAFL